jgi:hypothetical protein
VKTSANSLESGVYEWVQTDTQSAVGFTSFMEQILPNNLLVKEAVKKIPAFYGTQIS